MKFKALLISAFLVLSCTSVQAQVRSSIQTRLPGVAPYFIQEDPSSRFRTQRRGNDVLDLDAGVLRARYRISDYKEGAPSLSPDLASRTFLATVQDAFGLSETLDDLVLVNVISGRYGAHVTYQQSFEGIPVYGRFVKVNLDAAGHPTMVLSGYATHLATLTRFDTLPRYSSAAAGNQVHTLLAQDNLSMNTPQLVVYPAETPRLAWQIVAWPEFPALELEILIDATDGSVIHVQSTNTHSEQKAQPAGPSQRPSPVITPEAPPVIAGSAIGSGYVFDPDPLSTAGQFYLSPYLDNNDNDNNEINAQRVLVDLLDISLDNNGFYRLNGPHVQIVAENASGTVIYAPPAETDPNGFQYTRSNNFFEAVNVYYHIDKSQRYIQSLNVGHDIQNLSIRVNPHGLGTEDNSRYYLNQNFIAFGQGGVDDAEDAHVIWHEYGHALLHGSAPGLMNTSEGQALHEGWADYWAASYARSLVETSAVLRDDWRTLFAWDSGDGSIWPGREVAFVGKYPDDTFCDNGGGACDIYKDGSLWATALMEVYDGLGRETTDRLSLASHVYLMHPVSFRDAAEALIQSDADINGSANVDFLIQTFNEKGLLDLSNFGPIVMHDALQSTEQLGGAIPVTVNVSGLASPVARVLISYTTGDGPEETLELTASSDGKYDGLLPLPASPALITYFIEAEDQFGITTRLPASPSQTFSFNTGLDTEPPVILHTQYTAVTLVDWPAQLVADVTDNLSVGAVEVAYLVHDPMGNQIAADTFPLTLSAGEYKAVFPIPIETLEPGSAISYQLIARDASIAGNETRLPESGYYVLYITIKDGILRQYNFETETPGITASGDWQRGAPSFGLKIAHSAATTWATNPSTAYNNTAQRAILELPPVRMAGISEAYLVFWHWFDTEHDGTASPDSGPDALLWDGGNIKASMDGGVSWTVIEPENGYNGQIASGRENPLTGEPAFGGYSYGWQQVVAPLPAGSELRIRFDFGTDTGNTEPSLFYAGWYLDDIAILTEKPVDTRSPEALILSPAVTVRDPGQTPPEPYIQLFDSTGITSVFVDYAFQNDAGIPAGSFRLPMQLTKADVYTDGFPFESSTSFSVGDVLTYRFRVSDFAGNAALYPPENELPITVEYRLRDRLDLFEHLTPSGLWQQLGDHWEVMAQNKPQEISSLVFGPLNLPANVDHLEMLLFFEHTLSENNGGNIKISTDRANTWEVLVPTGGYSGFLSEVEAIPPGMRGQAAFTGDQPGLQQATFNLLDHKGKQIWLRADFGAQTEPGDGEFWRITEASLAYSTLEAVNGTFDIPRELALHANYPDPFSTATTIGYTLPAATRVKLGVYDMLGRRVATLVDAQQAEGTYSLTLDGSGLANGLYLLQLETNQGSQIERLMVAR